MARRRIFLLKSLWEEERWGADHSDRRMSTGLARVARQGRPEDDRPKVNHKPGASRWCGNSLIPQAIDRVGTGSTHHVQTDGQEGDRCSGKGRGHEYPPADFDTIGEIAEPAVHRKPGHGKGDQRGNEDKADK